jgi:integrase
MENYLFFKESVKGTGMGNYKEGKITAPLSDAEFRAGMDSGRFVKSRHKGMLAFLHYSGLRRSEIPRLRKEDFHKTKDTLYSDIRLRMKGSQVTPALPLPLDAPYVDEIVKCVDHTKKGQKVWPYSDKTVYNIVHRVFKYPHYHRLSRVTWIIEHYGILAARSWTGLSLQALEYYAGIVELKKVGEGLLATT